MVELGAPSIGVDGIEGTEGIDGIAKGTDAGKAGAGAGAAEVLPDSAPDCAAAF